MKFGMQNGPTTASKLILFQLMLVLAIGIASVASGKENPGSVGSSVNSLSETDGDLEKIGLKVQWFTQAGLGIKGELVGWDYIVDENQSTTFFELSGKNFREVFSELDRGPSGQPYGIDGGMEFAKLRKEIAEAELLAKYGEKIEVKISQYSTPKSTLYTLTSGDLVRAIDAETGKTIWKVTVANPETVAYGIGASDKYVVVAAGQEIHCLDANDGKFLWKKKCRSIISGPPTVGFEEVYVPLFNGRLERLSVNTEGRNSTAYVANGTSTTRGIITPSTVAWGSSKGDFSVGSRSNSRAIMGYQLKTNEPIVGDPVYHDRTFYVGSQNGFLYSIDELTGRVNWEVSTGGSISQTPIVINNAIYVVNDRGELHKFEVYRGIVAEGWNEPHKDIKSFLGASEKNIYFFDKFGDLEVVDQNTGRKIDSAFLGEIRYSLPHVKSDRFFVADSKGTIRCIREITSNNPFFHSKDADEMKAKESEDKEGQEDMEEENPFDKKEEVEDDPFRKNG